MVSSDLMKRRPLKKDNINDQTRVAKAMLAVLGEEREEKNKQPIVQSGRKMPKQNMHSVRKSKKSGDFVSPKGDLKASVHGIQDQ